MPGYLSEYFPTLEKLLIADKNEKKKKTKFVSEN